MGSSKLNDLVRIEVSKYIPDEDRETALVKISDPEAIETFRDLVEHAAKPEFYSENFAAPRYFVRLYSNKGVMDKGEVRRRYAFLLNEYLYMPRSEIWNLLERSVAS